MGFTPWYSVGIQTRFNKLKGWTQTSLLCQLGNYTAGKQNVRASSNSAVAFTGTTMISPGDYLQNWINEIFSALDSIPKSKLVSTRLKRRLNSPCFQHHHIIKLAPQFQKTFSFNNLHFRITYYFSLHPKYIQKIFTPTLEHTWNSLVNLLLNLLWFINCELFDYSFGNRYILLNATLKEAYWQ